MRSRRQLEESLRHLLLETQNTAITQDRGATEDYSHHQIRRTLYSNSEALRLLYELSLFSRHTRLEDLLSSEHDSRSFLDSLLVFGNFLHWVFGKHFYRIFAYFQGKSTRPESRHVRSFRNHLFVLGFLTSQLGNFASSSDRFVEVFVDRAQQGRPFLAAFFQSHSTDKIACSLGFVDCVRLFLSINARHTSLGLSECLSLVENIYLGLTRLISSLERLGHIKYVLSILGEPGLDHEAFGDFDQHFKFLKVYANMAETAEIKSPESPRKVDELDFSVDEGDVSEGEEADESSNQQLSLQERHDIKFENALRFLKRLEQPEEMHKNGKQAWNALKLLIWYTEKYELETIDLFEKYGTIDLLVKLIDYEHANITEYLREETDKDKPAAAEQSDCKCAPACVSQECKARIKSNNVCLNLLENAVYFFMDLGYYCQNTLLFSKAFHAKKKNLFAIFALIKDASWLEFIEKKPMSRIAQKLHDILEHSISLIYWLGKSAHFYESVWQECDSSSCLITFAETMHWSNKNYRRRALMTIRNMHDFTPEEKPEEVEKEEEEEEKKVEGEKEKPGAEGKSPRRAWLAFKYMSTDSEDTRNAKIVQAIEYLNELKEPERIIKSRTSRDAIIYLTNMKEIIKYESLNEGHQKGLMWFMRSFLEFSSKKLYNFFKILNLQAEDKVKACQVSEKADAIKIFYFLIDVFELCEYLSADCIKFCQDFGQAPDASSLDSLRLILGLVNSKHILKYLSTAHAKNVYLFLIKQIFDKAAEVIVNTFKYRFDEPPSEKEVPILTSFSKSFKENDDTKSKFEYSIQYFRHYLNEDGTVAYDALADKNMTSLLEHCFLVGCEKEDLFGQLANDLQLTCVNFQVAFIRHLYINLIDTMKLLEKGEKGDNPLKYDQRVLKFIKQAKFLDTLVAATQQLSHKSIPYSNRFNKSERGISLFFEILQNTQMFNAAVDRKYNQLLGYFMTPVYDSCLGTLFNMSKVALKYKEKWDSCEALKVLLGLVDTLKSAKNDKEEYQLDAYATIANIATDDDVSKLTELRDVVKNMSTYVNSCANMLADAVLNQDEDFDEEEPDCQVTDPVNEGRTVAKVERMTVQIDENEAPREVCQVTDSGWNLVELYQSLYRFAVNDSIKQFIYYEANFKEAFRKIVSYGNDTELEYSFRMMYQLCFDKKIGEDLSKDKFLFELISNLKTNRTGLIKSRDGILWLIKDQAPSQAAATAATAQTVPEKTAAEEQEHIMISYNRDSRDLCLKVKSALESMGYPVWIDVENIAGSSLESMANAIENSWCILIFMTEKYKASANCRLEAEYTMQLKKPFIPIVAQKNYKPDGWLGLILGSKIFVDVTKYEFGECVTRISKEMLNIRKELGKNVALQPAKESKTQASKDTCPPAQTDTAKESSASKWDQERVGAWFESQNIGKAIRGVLAPCSGEVLHQYFKMYLKMPKYFLNKLQEDAGEKISLRDQASFLNALEKLFEAK